MMQPVEKVKILICVVHGPYEPWLSILRDGQMKTWMRPFPGVRIINVFGKPIPDRLMKIDQYLYFRRWDHKKSVAFFWLAMEALIKTLMMLDKFRPQVNKAQKFENLEKWTFQMPDSLLLQGVKNISTLRAALDEDFDYLITTITSSYLNLDLIQEYLSAAPRVNFLGGRIEKSGAMEYQQGSFRIFSRDVVLNLTQNSSQYRHWLIEDIAMGRLANRKYSNFTNVPNETIDSMTRIHQISNSQLEKTLSYRCKSIAENFRMDSYIMQEIDRLLRKFG